MNITCFELTWSVGFGVGLQVWESGYKAKTLPHEGEKEIGGIMWNQVSDYIIFMACPP